jgi:hypothetical protein
MGFLGSLVNLISHNDAFSTCHAAGALWNLVVDNHDAKLALVSDEIFCKKLVELFGHSDAQVPHCVAMSHEQSYSASGRYRGMRWASRARCAARTLQ